MKRLLILAIASFMFASCGVTYSSLYYWGGTQNKTTTYEDLAYKNYDKQTPESICKLICMYEDIVSNPGGSRMMPPINNSTNVEAKELLYTSISRPLVDAGYYVVSPLLAMDILKAESAYDAELFFDAPLTKFSTFFGADAVVFSVIDSWAKKGMGIQTKIRYVIKSTYTNDILFDRSCDLYLDISVDTGEKGLLAAVV